MSVPAICAVPFTTLRDRLKLRADQLGAGTDLDLREVSTYLLGLPDEAHDRSSVDALIHLARNLYYAARPAETLAVAARATELARRLGDQGLLSNARGKEGVALTDLGRFAHAAIAFAESCSIARRIGDRKTEMFAWWSAGSLCGALGQYGAAVRYVERARELAETGGLTTFELALRNNLADCALHLRDPTAGLAALSRFPAMKIGVRADAEINCYAQITIARLHLLTGDVGAAWPHSEQASRLAALTNDHRLQQRAAALRGLIRVWSGDVDAGLNAVLGALAFAKQTIQGSVYEYLELCVDAYEVAGLPDKALEYLRGLVEWQKKTIAKEVDLMEHEGIPAPNRFQTQTWPAEDVLVAKAHVLHAGVRQRVEHLAETAINAEMTAGHDLYRTFRVAQLARNLAAALGWQGSQIETLSLGAQLCNIGMIAVPARISAKPGMLTAVEREVLQDHPRYGAELLRKSNLRLLDTACLIAEQHHERYDGTGYPSELLGEAITEEARIVAICDVFDAMTHRRPWRDPLSIADALNALKKTAGRQFDPMMVNTFIDFVESEHTEHDDFDAFLSQGAQELQYVQARERMEMLIQQKH